MTNLKKHIVYCLLPAVYFTVLALCSPFAVNNSYAIVFCAGCTELAPDGDDICNPTPVTLGSCYLAEESGCAGFNGGCLDDSRFTHFYSVVAPASGSVDISLTPGTMASLELMIFDPACGSPTFCACAPNNICPATGTSTITGMTPGLTYIFQVTDDGPCTQGSGLTYDLGIDEGGTGDPCSGGASCSDGIMNQDETGIDCGVGSVCDPPNGDCCANGFLDNGEEKTDCGGVCPAVCATCSDATQNQGETGVDCGGLFCPPCAGCTDNDDCVCGTVLTVNAACVVGDISGSSLEGGEGGGCGGIAPAISVWYKFTATATQMTVTVAKLSGACNLGSAVWDGREGCLPTNTISCEDINFGPDVQVHGLVGLVVGAEYYVQIIDGGGGGCGSQTFCIDVTDIAPTSCTGNANCGCGGQCMIYFGTCVSSAIDANNPCLGPIGCLSSDNAIAQFGGTASPSATTFEFTIDNLGAGWTGNVEIRVYNLGGCTVGFEGSACGPAPLTYSHAVSAGQEYVWFVSSSADDFGATVTFDICVGVNTTCTCGGTPGNAYGVYADEAAPAIAGVVDCEILAVGGTGGDGFLVSNQGADNGYASVAISGYPVITAENFSCTNTDVDFAAGASNTWNLGAGATNPTPTGTLVTTQYTTTGRKNIVYDVDTYTGFHNIAIAAPAPGSVLGISSMCPGTANYASSEAGSPGYSFLWTIVDPAGGTSAIATPTVSSTDITFTNSTAGDIIFPIVLTITTGCCGALTPILYNVTINPIPAVPSVVDAAPSKCIGGSDTLIVSSPDPTFNYVWFDAPTGGTSQGTRDTLIIDPVLIGTTNYYVEAVSANGCVSTSRTLVVLTGTDTPPTTTGSSNCAPGIQTVSVTSPISGATYNWYDALTGGTLLQSSTVTTYDVNVPGPAPQTVSVYVSVVVAGCGETTRTITNADLTVSPPVAHWTGAVSTDWFVAGNWVDGCVPNCGTIVRIDNFVPPGSPGGAVGSECSIDFANGGIACALNIRIQTSRTLTMVGSKAVLEVSGNWRLCGTFTAGSGLVRFNGSIAQTIGGTAVTTFENLTIDNSAATVQLLLNANVSGALKLDNGVLDLNNNTITITDGGAGAITRSGGSILSESEASLIQWNTNTGGLYVFPFGFGGEYIPFTFDKMSDPTTRNVSAGTWNTVLATNNPNVPSGTTLPDIEGTDYFVDRWWTITPVPWVDGVDSAGVTFAFTAAELATIINTGLDSAVTYHWNSGSTWWDQIDATVSGNSVTSKWFSFSGGGGGGKGNVPGVLVPLPIELLYFDAKPNGEVVDITWATASEINNDYFTVEKSTDASDFDIVVKVPGAGTSIHTLYYSAVDEDPYYGISYYRLKQTDYDGQYEYSGLVAVKFLRKLNFSVRPNPAHDYLEIVFGEISKNIIFVMTPEYDASINIYDARGELVYNKEFNGTFYKFNIDISSFSEGMYFVSLTANNELYKAKFVKE